jgi:hypothetical protein
MVIDSSLEFDPVPDGTDARAGWRSWTPAKLAAGPCSRAAKCWRASRVANRSVFRAAGVLPGLRICTNQNAFGRYRPGRRGANPRCDGWFSREGAV